MIISAVDEATNTNVPVVVDCHRYKEAQLTYCETTDLVKSERSNQTRNLFL